MKSLIYRSAAMTFAAIALFLFAANSAQAQNEHEIRRQIPEREKQISDGCEGAKVAIEVDFASFNGHEEALTYVPDQGLAEPAFGVVRYCTDSNNTSETDPVKVGKIKDKVKKIVLRFVPKASQKRITLQEGGVVLIEAAFGVTGGRFYETDIQGALGKLL